MALLEEKFGDWNLSLASPESPGFVSTSFSFFTPSTSRSGFLILDYANLIIHEGGHFFFSWFGDTIRILGGTLGELLVPLLCAAYFFFQRETTGFASACSGSSKISPISAPIWLMPAPPHCHL